MNSRIESLFSPEKLRQNWQGSLVPATNTTSSPSTHQAIYTHYLKLQRLMSERFTDLSRLSSQLTTLNEKIENAFGTDITTPATDKQKAEIVLLLEELEELLWALELFEQQEKQ